MGILECLKSAAVPYGIGDDIGGAVDHKAVADMENRVVGIAGGDVYYFVRRIPVAAGAYEGLGAYDPKMRPDGFQLLHGAGCMVVKALGAPLIEQSDTPGSQLLYGGAEGDEIFGGRLEIPVTGKAAGKAYLLGRRLKWLDIMVQFPHYYPPPARCLNRSVFI